MFARIVKIAPRMEKKDELIKVVRQEIVPILKKQPGFIELMPFVPEVATEHMFAITLWTEKRYAEKYAEAAFPKVEQILKPFLAMPVAVKMYTVETSLCKNLVDALTQVA